MVEKTLKMHFRQKEAKESVNFRRIRWLQRTTHNVAWLWSKLPGKKQDRIGMEQTGSELDNKRVLGIILPSVDFIL